MKAFLAGLIVAVVLGGGAIVLYQVANLSQSEAAGLQSVLIEHPGGREVNEY